MRGLTGRERSGPTVPAGVLEGAARRLVALRWVTLASPGRLGVEHAEVVSGLQPVADRLNVAVGRAVRNVAAGCVSCGELCAQVRRLPFAGLGGLGRSCWDHPVRPRSQAT